MSIKRFAELLRKEDKEGWRKNEKIRKIVRIRKRELQTDVCREKITENRDKKS